MEAEPALVDKNEGIYCMKISFCFLSQIQFQSSIQMTLLFQAPTSLE
jgi:hypothetical protein